jgi:predicted transcriptional regulator YheO
MPEVLFKEDYREQIHAYISAFLQKEGVTLKSLNREKTRELIRALHGDGAFKTKNAAAYIAQILQLSRATIYNYLR